MNGKREFLRKVKNDMTGLYHEEKDLIMENKIYIVLALFSVLMLVTPWGRWILKWSSYVFSGIIVMCALALIYANSRTLERRYKHDEKLKQLGTSREEEEEARANLCELEGDDALPPKRVIYFTDVGAMNHYADALYGCYLAQTFKAKYMELPDDAILYTTRSELRKLRNMEVDSKSKDSPYKGYTSFISANLHVVEPCYQSEEEVVIETALRVQAENDAIVVVVSTNEKLNELAVERGFEVINPMSVQAEAETLSES